MSQTIPTLTDSAFFSLRTRLDDQDYTLVFSYQTRGDNYSIDILDSEDKAIVRGLKVFTGVPLFAKYRYNPAVPRGELMPVTLTSDLSPPKFGELGEGQRVELTYFSAAEVAAMLTERGLL